jgi:signal peptidase II
VALVATPRHPLSSSRDLLVLVGYQVAVTVVLLDQATKRVAEVVLDRGVEVPLLGSHIGWQLVYNDGGAYGIDAPSWFFLVVTVVVTAIVVRNLPHAPGRRAAWAYGLLLAGALGNALDRMFRSGDPGDPGFLHGHVIDFVAWGSFPRFNVADVAITIGFGLLVLDLWRADDGDGAPTGPDVDDAGARGAALTGVAEADRS